jgi:hypothetical protein
MKSLTFDPGLNYIFVRSRLYSSDAYEINILCNPIRIHLLTKIHLHTCIFVRSRATVQVNCLTTLKGRFLTAKNCSQIVLYKAIHLGQI